MSAFPAVPPCLFFHFFGQTYVLRLVAREKGAGMKGYVTASGYMGFVDGRFMLFDSEGEYAAYMREAAQGQNGEVLL